MSDPCSKLPGKVARLRAGGALLLGVLLLLIASPANAGVPDQSQTSFGPSFFGAGICQTVSLAQSFTSGMSGSLDQVDVGVTRWEANTSVPLSIEIQTVSGGLPTGAVLAAATVPALSFPTLPGTFVSVPLDPPARVTANDQYALVLMAPNLDCSFTTPSGGPYFWDYVEGDAYTRGKGLLQFVGGGWIPPTFVEIDFTFITYVEPVIAAPIDVKPGSTTNPIKLASTGRIPVAILSSSSFDATTVDPSSVCFGDAEAPAQRDCTAAHSALEDVNADGRLDLLLIFETMHTGIDPGDSNACLTGRTFSGLSVEGCDSIKTL